MSPHLDLARCDQILMLDLAVKGENSSILKARYPQIPDFTPDEWKIIKGSSDL